MDYRELLKKYITHVGESNLGDTYLQDANRILDPPFEFFSDEEWDELKKINAEVVADGEAYLNANP